MANARHDRAREAHPLGQVFKGVNPSDPVAERLILKRASG
jgi:hypothetical protein